MTRAPGKWLLLSLLVVVLTVVQGQNSLRLRKSWDAFSAKEQETYIKAVSLAMKSGKHLLFTKLTMDAQGLKRVQGTAGEPAWHRKWLFGYENMLRSLGDEYATLTLPYWDVFEDSAMRLSSRSSCLSIQSCSSYLTAMGGSEGEDPHEPYFVNGEFAYGNCANRSVAAAACTDPSEQERCEYCIPRGDWDIEESTFEFGPSAFVEVLRHAASSKIPMETLRLSMATRFHYNLHNLLGGVYETRAAAFDPIYIGHYAMSDAVYNIYQRCHRETGAFVASPFKTPAGDEFSASSSIPMEIDGKSIGQFEELAPYFQSVGSSFAQIDDIRTIVSADGGSGYEYELDDFLNTLMNEFDVGCPAKSGAESLRFAENRELTPNRNASQWFVRAMATCAKSTLVGNISTKTEASYTAVVCELMSKQQNGVFTDFSATLRHTWNAPPSLVPTCVDVLESIADGSVKLQVTEECRQAFLTETSINTNEFYTNSTGFTVVSRGRDGTVTRMKGQEGS